MDNVQNCVSYINKPSSQTYRSEMERISVVIESLNVLVHQRYYLLGLSL
jgi:hypothetical protein